jgi:hypothetical protein
MPNNLWKQESKNILLVNPKAPLIKRWWPCFPERGWNTGLYTVFGPPQDREEWFRVEKKREELYVDGAKICWFQFPDQRMNSVASFCRRGLRFSAEQVADACAAVLEGKEVLRRMRGRSDNLDPRIMQALVDFGEGALIPTSWGRDDAGIRRVFHSWGALFTNFDKTVHYVAAMELSWRYGEKKKWCFGHVGLTTHTWGTERFALILETKAKT